MQEKSCVLKMLHIIRVHQLSFLTVLDIQLFEKSALYKKFKESIY